MKVKHNFKCPITGEEFFISNYKIGYNDEGVVYKDDKGRVLVNPKNNEPLVELKKEGDYNVNFGKIASMGIEDRKKVLKDRSKKHNLTQKDKFHSMNREDKG